MDEKVKGQVSIWVIVGIIIAASIMLLFVFSKGPKSSGKDVSEFEPESYLDGCAQSYADEILPNMDPNFDYDGDLVVGDDDDYDHMIGIIKNYIITNIESCFTDMKLDYNYASNSITYPGGNAVIDEDDERVVSQGLPDDRVYVIFLEVKKDVIVSEKGKETTYDNFHIEIKVRLPTAP